MCAGGVCVCVCQYACSCECVVWVHFTFEKRKLFQDYWFVSVCVFMRLLCVYVCQLFVFVNSGVMVCVFVCLCVCVFM